MVFNFTFPDAKLLEICKNAGAPTNSARKVYVGCVITEKFLNDLADWVETVSVTRAAAALRDIAKNNVGEKGGIIK